MIKQWVGHTAILVSLGSFLSLSETATAGVGYYYEAPSYYVAPPVYSYSPPAYSTFGFSTYPRYGYAGGYVGSRHYGSFNRYGDLYGRYPSSPDIFGGYRYGGYGTGIRPYASPYERSLGGRFR